MSLPFVPISKFSEFETGWKALLVLEIDNNAKSKNTMQIIGVPRESHKMSVF